MGSYAPRSPDLSAYQSTSQQAPEPYRSDSFSLPQPSYYSSMPQPSYQYSQQQPQHQQPPPYNYNSAPTFPDYSQNPYNNGLRTPSAVKQEDPPWFPPQQGGHGGHGGHVKAEPGTGRGKGGAAALKSEQSAATQIKNEPRVPAPGEEEGIVVKTKFPVARIKRIVQADEDVGKVAQVTPIVVAKALELFMISITLSAAAEAKARGSKRVSGQHLKQAVQKAEQFDFLSDIVSRIPDAPASKEGKAKPEGSDDDDFGDEEKKPKRGRAGAGAGGRRKRRTKDDDDD